MRVRDTVVSLCDRTGAMVEPWRQEGHQCLIVDVQHPPGLTVDPDRPGLTMLGADVCHLPVLDGALIVFAFPPCTDLANSGARWFRDKGLGSLIGALTVVERCRELCESSGAPWMLENPVGQLATYWRPPDLRFDPCDFAGWADDPSAEAYTKKTCLWVGGGFIPPRQKPVEPTLGSLFHRTPPGPDRANIRSVTPIGFARAVHDAMRFTCTVPFVVPEGELAAQNPRTANQGADTRPNPPEARHGALSTESVQSEREQP